MIFCKMICTKHLILDKMILKKKKKRKKKKAATLIGIGNHKRPTIPCRHRRS